MLTYAWYSAGWWELQLESENLTCSRENRTSVLPRTLALLQYTFLQHLNDSVVTGTGIVSHCLEYIATVLFSALVELFIYDYQYCQYGHLMFPCSMHLCMNGIDMVTDVFQAIHLLFPHRLVQSTWAWRRFTLG